MAALLYHGTFGIARAIPETLHGISIGALASAHLPPIIPNGIDMPAHIVTNTNIVENGTASDDPDTQANKFKLKKMEKIMPGRKSCDKNAVTFQNLQPKNLW